MTMRVEVLLDESTLQHKYPSYNQMPPQAHVDSYSSAYPPSSQAQHVKMQQRSKGGASANQRGSRAQQTRASKSGRDHVITNLSTTSMASSKRGTSNSSASSSRKSDRRFGKPRQLLKRLICKKVKEEDFHDAMDVGDSFTTVSSHSDANHAASPQRSTGDASEPMIFNSFLSTEVAYLTSGGAKQGPKPAAPVQQPTKDEMINEVLSTLRMVHDKRLRGSRSHDNSVNQSQQQQATPAVVTPTKQQPRNAHRASPFGSQDTAALQRMNGNGSDLFNTRPTALESRTLTYTEMRKPTPMSRNETMILERRAMDRSHNHAQEHGSFDVHQHRQRQQHKQQQQQQEMPMRDFHENESHDDVSHSGTETTGTIEASNLGGLSNVQHSEQDYEDSYLSASASGWETTTNTVQSTDEDSLFSALERQVIHDKYGEREDDISSGLGAIDEDSELSAFQSRLTGMTSVSANDQVSVASENSSKFQIHQSITAMDMLERLVLGHDSDDEESTRPTNQRNGNGGDDDDDDDDSDFFNEEYFRPDDAENTAARAKTRATRGRRSSVSTNGSASGSEYSWGVHGSQRSWKPEGQHKHQVQIHPEDLEKLRRLRRDLTKRGDDASVASMEMMFNHMFCSSKDRLIVEDWV